MDKWKLLCISVPSAFMISGPAATGLYTTHYHPVLDIDMHGQSAGAVFLISSSIV